MPLTGRFAETAETAVPLVPIAKAGLEDWLGAADPAEAAWVRATGFRAGAGELALVPGPGGGLARALAGTGEEAGLWSLAGLPSKLPEGAYALAPPPGVEVDSTRLALGWALGGYRFDRYRKAEAGKAVLVWPDGCDRAAVENLAASIGLVRDLINTPAADMGPAELAEATNTVAAEFGATVRITEGDALLEGNFPMIHAVGRASSRAPRLIEMEWGEARHPRVAVIGKGVVFDTGGLDLKPSNGMLLMKKDMGGAAHALGLARLIMAAGLPVRLHLLVPAVENAVSGNAFRPMDILTSRKGTTVEIGNTDAEGRLVLADAITRAGEDEPVLVVDFATLTGAARVALGTELPALFANDDALAADTLDAAGAVDDPVWRLPLHQPYRKLLKSEAAELSNVGSGGFGGAITAALFLEHFVPEKTPWIHLDLMAWNTADQPGRPKGGEAMGLRAVFEMLRRRFAG